MQHCTHNIPLAIVIIFVGFFLNKCQCQSEDDDNYDLHPNWRLFSDQCGDSFADRIIGGKQASIGQFPWLARVGSHSKITQQIHFGCGGTLINPYYVLTAAHCFDSRQSHTQTWVRLGELKTNEDPDCSDGVCAPPVQDIFVQKVIIHERHNIVYLYANDIALLQLEHQAIISDFVSPICLPKSDMSDGGVVGTTMQVAGWGYTNSTTQELPTTLMFVSIPIVDISECNEVYKSYTQVGENQLCGGGQENQDSCSGDSGGPLMSVYSHNGPPRYYVMGVVSFGPDSCGKEDMPAIYTAVSQYMTWILNHVRK